MLSKLFFRPEASAATLLNNWVDQFKNDPEKRLVVYQAARDKLIADVRGDPQAARTLAGVQQNIGDTLMALKEWDKAAVSFRASMAYWQNHNGLPATVAQLSEQLVTALLRAKNYQEAAQFAAERISVDPQELGDLGFLLRAEVE